MRPGQPASTSPFVYVVIPLLAVFFICSACLFFHVRRRHRRRLGVVDGSVWGRGRWVMQNGTLVFVSRNSRRSPAGGLPSQEGLNELGEAPPPYKFKTMPGQETAAPVPAAAAAAGEETELRDLEVGRRPPEYVAEPAAAVVVDSRRMGI